MAGSSLQGRRIGPRDGGANTAMEPWNRNTREESSVQRDTATDGKCSLVHRHGLLPPSPPGLAGASLPLGEPS